MQRPGAACAAGARPCHVRRAAGRSGVGPRVRGRGVAAALSVMTTSRSIATSCAPRGRSAGSCAVIARSRCFQCSGSGSGTTGFPRQPGDGGLDERPRELTAPREALQQHEAEGVHVAGGTDVGAARLLRAEVGGRAGRDAVRGQPFDPGGEGDPEVGQPRTGPVGPGAVVDEQDVRGLDVAVHDAVRVDVLERFGHVVADLGDVLRGERSDLEPGLQVLSDDERHHEEAPGAAPDDVDDARVQQPDQSVVLERREDAELGLLPCQVDGTRVEELHRDGPVQHLVGGSVHDGHAAPTDLLLEPVAPVEERRRVVVSHGFLVVLSVGNDASSHPGAADARKGTSTGLTGAVTVGG